MNASPTQNTGAGNPPRKKTWTERAIDSAYFSRYCNAMLTANLADDDAHEKRNVFAALAIGEVIKSRGGEIPQRWQVETFGSFMGAGAVK